jgi:serine/threonine-protein kinase
VQAQIIANHFAGRGLVIDHRSDLWSLGVVVYQCLLGQVPFVSNAMGELMMKIIVEPLPVPSQVGPVPPGFA